MNIQNTGRISALFLVCISLSACGGAASSNASGPGNAAAANSANSSANAPKTNAEELGLLVNMPFETEEIVWNEDQLHKRVIAVMRFSPENSKKLIAEAEKFKQPEKVTISIETWFPPELVAQGDMNGEDSVAGLAYPANMFFQSPYNEGRITHIEDSDYFVLEVSAK